MHITFTVNKTDSLGVVYRYEITPLLRFIERAIEQTEGQVVVRKIKVLQQYHKKTEYGYGPDKGGDWFDVELDEEK